MKSGNLFWGLFLITLGSLYFLTEYNIINMSWDFIWNFWAAVFIFWGLQLLTKNTKIRIFIDGIFGIILAILIFGSVSNIIGVNNCCDDSKRYSNNVFSTDTDSTYVFADLEINGGAGSFILKDSTNKLIKGISQGDLGYYSFNEEKQTERVFLKINQLDEKIKHIRGDLRNRLEIKLNTSPVWNISLNVGASKNYIDLSNFKVQNFNLKCGVSKSEIKLGERFENTEIDVEMGVSSLQLLIPKETGCKIEGEMALVLKNLEGFTKNSDGSYYNKQYGNAKNRIIINMNSGVSKFKINTY
ncbi:MAG: hypothetical protein GXX85_07480 [Ignavibacteria bacterium]|nr:hypothetical protein [Ignavibacteria bacterium]